MIERCSFSTYEEFELEFILFFKSFNINNSLKGYTNQDFGLLNYIKWNPRENVGFFKLKGATETSL